MSNKKERFSYIGDALLGPSVQVTVNDNLPKSYMVVSRDLWDKINERYTGEVNLYHVQDPDRPMYVIARDWNTALDKWKRIIREENDGEEGDEPLGISLIAENVDLIL